MLGINSLLMMETETIINIIILAKTNELKNVIFRFSNFFVNMIVNFLSIILSLFSAVLKLKSIVV
ncbi:hypothetical protein WR164_05360 [Philodulcilactobacillus myokoensis]|uniref:Uncharacterized protein n=1 Tax=Philodulcilactobacillus myokoensis TaxID=2929573 RepID=A0A9W6B0G5_9LACO|nr:hypothetical protein WR164_05360 [Philodulcilactobacillus myokoensis]